MLPSAIEMDDGFDPLDMDIAGALHHQLIRTDDLAAGRWDNASVRIGLVDWELPDDGIGWLWSGQLGAVSSDGAQFSAELRGIKARLDQAFAPVASPSCRAAFCGEGCGLNRAAFEVLAVVAASDEHGVTFDAATLSDAAVFLNGRLRWVSGGNVGLGADIIGQCWAARCRSTDRYLPILSREIAPC